MNLMRTFIMVLLILAGLTLFIQPAFAETEVQKEIIYQTNFATNPGWTTNSPRSYYWVPEKQVYHYAIEASTGAYAFVPVDYENGPFLLEYDLTPQSTEENSAFRFGLTKDEMLRTEGPVTLTEFTNGKKGMLMSFRAVTPSNNLYEVTSYSFSYGEKTGAPTVKFVDNKTYHVTLEYDNVRNTLTMRVYDKTTGTQVWGYFMTTNEEMKGMDRLAMGPLGDFSSMGPVAAGYLDNVILSTTKEVKVTPTAEETTAPVQTASTRATTKPTTKPTTVAPTTEPTSPVALPTILAALGVTGAVAVYARIVAKR